MGRISRGVRGIRMKEGDSVIGMVVPVEQGKVLTVSEHGYGKRTEVGEFPTKGRGGQGVIAMSVSERNGALVGAVQVLDGEELMLISDQGTLVRTRVDEVSVLSRNTQGVRLIKLREGEHMSGVARIEEPEDEDPLAEDEQQQSDDANNGSSDSPSNKTDSDSNSNSTDASDEPADEE